MTIRLLVHLLDLELLRGRVVRNKGSLVLVIEEKPLLFAEKRAKQDRQVNASLHQSADVELLLKLLGRFLLQTHALVFATETRGEAETPQP